MPVTVEISNPAKLRRVRSILGAKSDNEAAELALEKVIEDHEPAETKPRSHDLPDEYWDDLFSSPMIPSSVIDAALSKERE